MIILLRPHYSNDYHQTVAVQAELKRIGLYQGKIDGIYGEKTADAVERFQNLKSLLTDRIVGPITWSRLFPDDSEMDAFDRSTVDMDIRKAKPIETLIKVAEKYIGLRELPGNRGPKIDQWLLDLRVPIGNPWCMGFVQGAFAETASILGTPDPLKPDTAGCMDLWNRVPKSWRRGVQEGRRGDIAIWNHGGGKGHTGIVKGYAAGFYTTIEGNTNDDGSREGREVCEKDDRKYNDHKLAGFIRVPWTGFSV